MSMLDEQTVWCHIAHTPDGIHVHQINQSQLHERAQALVADGVPEGEAEPLAVGQYAQAIRDELGFPEDWVAAQGWNSSLAPGQPHRDLMKVATCHPRLPVLPDLA